TSAGVKGLQKTAFPSTEWIGREALGEAEPTLGHALGAMLNPDDGAVDNVTLMRALAALADQSPAITRLQDTVTRVKRGGVRPSIELTSGKVLDSAYVVVAGGAWSSLIEGIPFAASVTPVRGQLIAYDAIGLRHVVYGPRGYLVPRVNLQTVAGSTMENVGFDSTTSL